MILCVCVSLSVCQYVSLCLSGTLYQIKAVLSDTIFSLEFLS